MKDKSKTGEKLIKELAELRQRVAEFKSMNRLFAGRELHMVELEKKVEGDK